MWHWGQRLLALLAASLVSAQAHGKVGLCVAGPIHRLPPDATLATTREVARGLGADTFVVLISKGANPPVPPGLSGWVAGHQAFADGSGPATLRTEYARANLENKSGDLLAAYASVGGNFLGPLVGDDGRNAFLVRDLWRCAELMRSHERKHGIAYSYWAFSRIDNHWLATLPPVELLEFADPRAIWIPDGQDWDGMNDRFALVPRAAVATYFDRWPRVLNGSLLGTVRAASKHKPLNLKFNAGPEWLLMAALHGAAARVRRFPGVAGILCQQGSKRGRYGRCTKPFPPTNLMFKYSSEVSEAHSNLRLIEQPGWEWRATDAGPVLEPPCFQSDDERRGCCNTREGLNGRDSCWTDVYSFARCCQSWRPGVWVLPSAATARELLAAGRAPVCWTTVIGVQMCLKQEQLERLARDDDSGLPAKSRRSRLLVIKMGLGAAW